MATVAAICGIRIVGTYSGPGNMASYPTERIDITRALNIGPAQADQYLERSVTSTSLSQNINLGVGSLEKDAYLTNIAMTSARCVVVGNEDTDSGDHIFLAGSFITSIGGVITNLKVDPGGFLFFMNPNGYTVGGGATSIAYQRGANDVSTRIFVLGHT